jgi:nicotinate-nucleotide--dimethylbenzimidazole phosphoribosyltransferase
MTQRNSMKRPPTPPGFDQSRAAERAANPAGWRFSDDERASIYRVIAERRDIRRFRPDEVDDETLTRVLSAAHSAPSVGLMQPWRFIVIREDSTRIAVRHVAQRERMRQAERFDERARQFLDQKIEGIVDAPIGVCVCCDHGRPDVEILGRGTIPETDVYSTSCAIENLWLAARGEGLGVGWVSFYQPDDLREILDIPRSVDPIAYLCIGWPDERPTRPGLESAAWASRMPLSDVVMIGGWQTAEPPPKAPPYTPDRSAVTAVRDRLDQLVKPAGSLGALEVITERWASVTGSPPPGDLRAGVLVCAADHGHTSGGTSLFGSTVSTQVAAAAARGQSAVSVLARRGNHALVVADIGLHGPTPEGVRDCKVAAGSGDMTTGDALTMAQVEQASQAGAMLAQELIDAGCACVVLGEIGIGNTATSAAIVSALTGEPPTRTVGRGTGLDSAGIDRKRAAVASALERSRAGNDPDALFVVFGGLELAALAGAATRAAELRTPVVIDGYATGAAALCAVRKTRAVGEALIASHRSAEPGHDLVLRELGLEPLLDLRLRLGEASGALLALPLIAAAGALFREMSTFDESGVDGPNS